MQTIKWGVLGYARIAKNSVIPAIIKSDNSTLYAVATGSQEKQQECRELFQCPHLYSQYDELLDDPEIQAVYVPLPNSLHKEWAIKAMEKGKHVLCEKPIALNASECEEMIRIAEKNGVLLMEAFMYRYTDRTKKVKAIVESGEIGEVRYIQSTFRFLLDRPNTIKVQPELGGGSLYDVGSYPVNFVGMIMNQVPESCVSECVKENGVDVMFSALLKYSNGAIASISCGFNAFNQMNSEIVGTKGRIEVPDTFLGTEGSIRVITTEGIRQVQTQESDRYTLEVSDFADAILNNRQPLIGLEETHRNMQVIDLLIKSM
ncbi:Gfo/Idh/MocA family protein [Paenibacillus sp. UNC451MF]|uniref:Gfo/Idh/MocA family protein n=1 Tax=Paenibacillus sp. UNC451MF TaxID=1449063 RepID=UPI00048F1625|nr:Gfo/Idh/MocA family oxidoreductase [Paenibacillus sp. UNC451MF]